MKKLTVILLFLIFKSTMGLVHHDHGEVQINATYADVFERNRSHMMTIMVIKVVQQMIIGDVQDTIHLEIRQFNYANNYIHLDDK